MKNNFKTVLVDCCTAIIAGIIVGTAYYIFQNSNSFAPGGVGGLATITYYLLNYKVSWAILMLAFNIPIFVLVVIFVDKKLGFYLILYMSIQSLSVEFYGLMGVNAYCLENNNEDFEIVFACIATGVISGLGFSIMLKRFGASGGTYAISALIKKAKPETNIAYVAFFLDSSVVIISFFVYGMKVTPALCTLLNLFIANVVVDYVLSGIRNGYKFEIITNKPTELSKEIMDRLGHGVTKINVHGMYSDSDKYMLICIIAKKQIGEMMKILKKYEGNFTSFEKVNDIFGRFKR